MGLTSSKSGIQGINCLSTKCTSECMVYLINFPPHWIVCVARETEILLPWIRWLYITDGLIRYFPAACIISQNSRWWGLRLLFRCKLLGGIDLEKRVVIKYHKSSAATICWSCWGANRDLRSDRWKVLEIQQQNEHTGLRSAEGKIRLESKKLSCR